MNDVSFHANIHFDREYDDDEKKRIFANQRYYIRKTFNIHLHICKSLRHVHSTRIEFEIIEYDRKYVNDFIFKIYIFIFYFLFIDDFEIHRNNYRNLQTYYLISACFSYSKRKKIANVFTLILKSHKINTIDVTKNFRKFIQQLN